jgi:hypothetical protein
LIQRRLALGIGRGWESQYGALSRQGDSRRRGPDDDVNLVVRFDVDAAALMLTRDLDAEEQA